ncbi:hypothetical protein VMCG_08325 [Cytospora schulzeri]|uniref:Uncharacterized protein n=1 Tax=Cytospora schulzeri TaxID=448051 RepID=A0A423VV62_9PEZI|nr:hypothetical protein VMCG_08325 [Valsa malicola]
MELTHAHALQERQDPSAISYGATATVFGIFAICLAVTGPMIWILVWMRNDDNPDHIRRQLQRQGVFLPTATTTTTTDQSTQDRPQKSLLLAGKLQLIASRLRGYAVTAGHALVPRCQQVYVKLQECLAKLSPTSLRRRNTHTNTATIADSTYDLPIMRKPAWQRLAGSYTSGTIGRSKNVVGDEEESRSRVDADDDAKVVDKAGDTWRSGGGGGDDVDVDVQKPKPVLAVGWAA